MIFLYAKDFVRYICSTKSKVIGITSGCFDLLHPLHVEYLNKCKSGCDELFVMIDSDRLVYQNKDKTPLINELDRAFMVDNLKSVSGTLIINQLYEIVPICNEIGDIIPLIVFKNGIQIYGSTIFTYNSGVQNIVIPDIIKFQSTTEIVNHLNNQKLNEKV